MRNPFMTDDNDDVYQFSWLRLIKVILAVIVVSIIAWMLFGRVETARDGVLGMVLLGFEALGIFGPLIVIALLIAAYTINKAADKEDKWIRAEKKKTARWLLIIALVLLVYSIVIWVIHILVTIGYVATHP